MPRDVVLLTHPRALLEARQSDDCQEHHGRYRLPLMRLFRDGGGAAVSIASIGVKV